MAIRFAGRERLPACVVRILYLLDLIYPHTCGQLPYYSVFSILFQAQIFQATLDVVGGIKCLLWSPSHSGHKADPERPPVGAKTCREQVQHRGARVDYSINSAARCCKKPSAGRVQLMSTCRKARSAPARAGSWQRSPWRRPRATVARGPSWARSSRRFSSTWLRPTAA